jgi:hypothetical protein
MTTLEILAMTPRRKSGKRKSLPTVSGLIPCW